MSSDETNPKSEAKIVQFPISDEERNRRVMAEAVRLANLAPGEWKIWLEVKAKDLGIEANLLAELVQAQIKDRGHRAAEKLKQDKQQDARAKEKRLAERDRQREQQRIEDAARAKAKEKARAFLDIRKLSSDQHDSKIDELAKRLEEDPAALKAEFADYCAAAGSTPVSEWDATLAGTRHHCRAARQHHHPLQHSRQDQDA